MSGSLSRKKGRTVSADAAAALLLYVEDEVLIQETLMSALTEAGYEVLAVTSGAEGLEVLESRSGELRGLITDINLGAGVDGWDVARRARELINGLPVVYVSGASHQEWTSKGVPET
jgi:CheY-like chemotaxis protein